MKKLQYLIIVLAASSMTSCNKMPCNGLLDGQWQLMEVQRKESNDDSVYSQVQSKKMDRIYWAFQLDLLNIRSNTKVVPDAFARFEHQGRTLDITSIYLSERVRDVLVTDEDTELFESAGISGNHERYEVEALGHERMILKTETKRLIFRKF